MWLPVSGVVVVGRGGLGVGVVGGVGWVVGLLVFLKRKQKRQSVIVVVLVTPRLCLKEHVYQNVKFVLDTDLS